MAEPTPEKIRVDKWLWFARFFKTRGLATKLVSAGHLRINSDRAGKPSATVGAGDILTFPQANRVRVVRVLAVGSRRGPAPEAQWLYEDLTPENPPEPRAVTHQPGGRPTKKDRRQIQNLKGEF